MTIKPSVSPFDATNKISKGIFYPCPSAIAIIRLHHPGHLSASVYSDMFYRLVLR